MRKKKLYLSEFIQRYEFKLELIHINLRLNNGTLVQTYLNFKEMILDLKETPMWNLEIYKWNIGENIDIYLK